MANQTHKTIIFEEFDNTKSENLFTILSNDDPSGDELIIGLKKLTVSTFQEFMDKFAPKVYEAYSRNADGGIEFFYTTDPTKYAHLPYSEIDIKEHIYYQMMERLYESKGQSGKANLEFNDSEIMEMLTPKKELDEIRNTRQKMEYNLKRFYEAKDVGDKSTMNACRKKLLECRETIAKYSMASLNKLLPILIEDNTKKLELLNAASPTDNQDDTKALPAPTFGRLIINAAGYLDIEKDFKEKTVPSIAAPREEKKSEGALVEVKDNLPAEVKVVKPQESVKTIPSTEELQDKIATTILKDYEENATAPNETIKSLIVSAFAPLASQSNADDKNQALDRNVLLRQRQNFEDAYINSRQSFIREMSKIVESLLGVKTFFDHATAEGGAYSPIPGGVIISNCKASRLLEIKDKFAEYMKYLGKDQTEQRVWFAVLPNVLENPPIDDDDIYNDIDDGMGGSLKDSQAGSKKLNNEYVSINALKEFLKVMESAKITTVFNIRNEKNTASNLSSEELKGKMKDFDSYRYGHAVYAYPNFTLIRDRDKLIFEDRPDAQITLPGIYVDAAYPAAGLLVASQQQKVLDSYKLKYDKDSVCVGVDFENSAVKKAFQTKFNRESVFRRSEDLIKTINANMFGFSFSGDEVKDKNGTTWQNSYVHCARSLAKNAKTGLYKPVCQTLIEDFIVQELNTLADRKKSDIREKVESINREWADKNKQNRYAGIVNSLLREKESIDIDDTGDKVKLHFNFVGGDGYVDIEVQGD